MIYLLLFSFLTLFFNNNVYAEINFKHYNSNNGLSDNTINCIYQDKTGFLWFGTNNGLNRFDGNSFKTFSFSEVPENDIIYSITEDNEGNILLGTNKGITAFNLRKETFEKLKTNTTDNHIISNDVYGIAFDKNRNMLINNYPNLYIIKRNSNIAEKINPYINGHLSSYLFNDKNELLIGIANKGIVKYDIEKGETVFIGEHKHTPRVMNRYHGNKFLIGTLSRGLFVMDDLKGKEYKIKSDIYDIENIYVNSITELSDKSLWIGSMNGIFILKNDSIINQLENKRFNDSSLSDNDVISIFQDRDNNIWIGTRNAGINYLSNNSKFFNISTPSDNYNNIKGNTIKCIENEGNGFLWTGFKDGGLALFNAKNNRFENIPYKSLRNISSKVYCIERNKDELWIGTYSDGIYKVDVKNNTVRHYYKNNKPQSLYVNEVYCIFTDSRNNIWIGTTEVLFHYNRKEDNFSHIQKFDGSHIRAITEDNNGNLWIATANNGAFKMSVETGKIQQYEYKKNNGSLIYGNLTDIKCDNKGRIWICSKNGGICYYEEKTNTFKRLTTRNRLPSNNVFGLVIDNNNIWATTDKGIVCIDDSSCKITGVIGKDNYLHSIQFEPSCGMAYNSCLYWGTSTGLMSFNPKNISLKKNIHNVTITSFSALNKEISSADSCRKMTNTAVPYTEGFVLEHHESSFRIGFSAMDFEHSNTGFYSYKLENLEKEWIIRQDIKEVNYQNIKPGNYVFKIRYSHDGVNWDNPVTQIKIVINPPFWATKLAWSIYIIIIVFSIYIIVKYLNKRKLEQKKEEKRKWEEQKKEELYKAKTDFFTYMAHEIRTPITLVKAPLEKIKDSESLPQELKKDFSLMEYNINRLHLILTDFLELRRLESGVFSLHPKKVNVNIILKMLISSYSNVKEYGNKNIIYPEAEQELNVFADEEAIIAILGNLISNAVKYSDKEIIINSKEEDGYVKIVISNDGKPISDELKEKIFEPFVRDEKSDKEGTGIGLAFANMLVKRHNGKLSLKNTAEKTTFELVLPSHNVNKTDTEEKEQDNKYSILLVEDNLDLIEFIKNELENEYNIFTAYNGKEAMELINKHDVDLIISDVMMPVMDGIELCMNIKNNFETCHIPVILLTAKANHENKIQGIECGADVYIEKPFSIQYVKTWIKNIISNHNRIKEKILKEPVDNVLENSYSGQDLEFLNKVKTYIENNIEDEELNIDKVAEEIGMSRSSFHRKIKALTGQAPGELITMIRLDIAAKLLKEPGCRVGEVCSRIGFKSISHFSRSFQKRFGTSPKNYSVNK